MAIANWYPCEECRGNFAKRVEDSPPPLDDRESLMDWLCASHNLVNDRNDKELFNCNYDDLYNRWNIVE